MVQELKQYNIVFRECSHLTLYVYFPVTLHYPC